MTQTAIRPGPLALVVHEDGSAELLRLPGPGAGTMLAAIQGTVGGFIEAVATAGGDWVAYINEEGKAHGLRHNIQADALCRALGFPFMNGDYLVGPAVFLGRDGDDPDETDVPRRVLELARFAGMTWSSNE